MDMRPLALAGLTVIASLAAEAQEPGAAAPPPARFDVLAYQVVGNTLLDTLTIERAVYPYLGPQRTEADVEAARQALQAIYDQRGYPTVSVGIPEQDASTGLITLQVSEQRVGRLRVVGADYFSPDDIARGAPSLSEGAVPNFRDVQRDIVALNQLPDRRVTPEVKAGAVPGTVDVDLNVEDALPLHGTLELNNRNSANTSELRLSGTIRYDNLWQRGHSLSLSAQIAPQNTDDAKVVSASYLARFGQSPWSLLGYAVRSDSDVSALGAPGGDGFNVIGNGLLAGLRLIRAFPPGDGFFHSLSLGLDYKDFEEDMRLGSDRLSSPIRYFPWNVAYTADWVGERARSNLGVTVAGNVRGIGDGREEFDAKRYDARPSFMHLRLEGSHTRTFGSDYQLFARLQAQFAGDPLISNEEFSIGGLDTVRGYHESEALGDYGAAAQLELRSPSFAAALGESVQEARLRLFADGGYARIHDPLPDQLASETLVSAGLGATLRAFERFNGSVDVAAPLSRPAGQKQDDVNVLFRLWGEF